MSRDDDFWGETDLRKQDKERSASRSVNKPSVQSNRRTTSHTTRSSERTASHTTRPGESTASHTSRNKVSNSKDAIRRRQEIQRRKKKKRRKRMIARALVVSLMILMLVLLIMAAFFLVKKIKGFRDQNALSTETQIVDEGPAFIGLNGISSTQAQVTKYMTYGVHLNVTGDTPTSQSGAALSYASLCLVDAYEKEEEPDTEVAEDDTKKSFFSFLKKEPETETETETESTFTYEKKAEYSVLTTTNEDGSIHFYTSDKINTGITLETVPQGEYCMLLSLTFTDGTTEYRTLSDVSGEEAIDYYTITQNGSNNHIVFSFASDDNMTPYASITCAQETLPDDVYDIVIDAGHGGNDGGTVSGSLTEAELTLTYAKSLKSVFEAAGYKVFLTRDGSEGDEKMAYTMYDEDGRVNIACRSRAKVCYCIHFNGNNDVTEGGVEVYCSNRSDPSFAKLIADNMVSSGNTTYSNMKTYKVEDGVYMRTYTQNEIAKSDSVAASKGFASYGLDETIDYLFMIRELGGIATDAYIDGRNTTYGRNLYRDANYGIESFLIEVAYMSVKSDLQNSIDNEAGYVQGMAAAFETWLQGLYTES